MAVDTPWPVPIWDAATTRLIAQDVGSGVYAIVADTAEEGTAKGELEPTSGGVVVGEDAAMLIETMMTPGLARQALDLVEQVTDRPLRYVANTVDHGDHYFGNYLMPTDTLIIQSEAARQRIESAGIEALKTQQMGWFDRGKGIEEVRYRRPDLLVGKDSRLVVELGGQTVEAIDFGEAQSPADIWFWVPKAKVMFSGNAFICEKPAIPWLLDGVAAAPAGNLRKIYEWLPDDVKIVPGHGRVTGKDGMLFFVEYTEELVRRVAEAVDRGLDLEATKQQVAMDEYNAGYPLWDWLHYDVNITTAFNELTRQES